MPLQLSKSTLFPRINNLTLRRHWYLKKQKRAFSETVSALSGCLMNNCFLCASKIGSSKWDIGIIILSMADEELGDQKKYLEDSCKSKCVKPLIEYEACVKRIQDDEIGNKHCTGQFFDYWFCVDQCVAPKLFTELK